MWIWEIAVVGVGDGQCRHDCPLFFELIIFDCDGVLVDSESITQSSHAHVLTASRLSDD